MFNNNCTTCKYFKKTGDRKHARCENKHLLLRDANLPLIYFLDFMCSQHEIKNKI